MTEFGRVLHRLMRQRKWSQGDIARRSGYDRSTISRWIHGNRPVGRDDVEVLPRVLMRTPDEEEGMWGAAGYIREDRKDFFRTLLLLLDHVQQHFQELAKKYVRAYGQLGFA